MTNEQSETPSDVVGRRINEVRKRRSWTAAQLAERVQEATGFTLSAQGVFNMENGRRKDGVRRRNISVDELLPVALALDVAPVHLMVPLEAEHYAVAPGRTLETTMARTWVRGVDVPPGADRRIYFSEVPEGELNMPASMFLTESEMAEFREWFRARHAGQPSGQE